MIFVELTVHVFYSWILESLSFDIFILTSFILCSSMFFLKMLFILSFLATFTLKMFLLSFKLRNLSSIKVLNMVFLFFFVLVLQPLSAPFLDLSHWIFLSSSCIRLLIVLQHYKYICRIFVVCLWLISWGVLVFLVFPFVHMLF